MPDDGEQVTLILPSGKKQAFLIPSGMSDNEAKLFVRSKRPDLFQSPETPPSNAGIQSKQQLMSKMTELMNVSGHRELMGSKPARNPDIEATLGALPAVGGTVGGALGGVPGAALGGGAGEAANQLIRRAAGDVPVTNTPGTDIGKQAAIMGTAEGVGKYALSPFLKWLSSSKSVGAQALGAASAKAGNAPVELSPQTNELVDKLVESSKLGGKPVKVISDLLERVGPSTKQAAEAASNPLTYNEARILQGNISSLSAEEQIGLKGSQKGLMKQLAASFGKDVQAAADAAGAGPEHAIGMHEYAAASAKERTLANVGRAAKPLAKGALGAIGAGSAYELYRMLTGQR